MLNNRISEQVEAYIAYKRSLGYQILIEAQELRRFAAYTRDIEYEGAVCHDIAIRWASMNSDYSSKYKSRRLETVHTFAKYAAVVDSEAQIPRTGVFGKNHGRVTPYIFDEDEICLLMEEAENLFSPDDVRKYTVSVALGLLWSTGLRVSELVNLTLKDVYCKEGYIHIRNTKFKKERFVPINASAVHELERYSRYLSEKFPERVDNDYFFITSYGKHFGIRAFEYAFTLIRPCLPDKQWRGRKPRLYDVRHSFACQTILRWLKNGEDVNRKMYLLSVYMGHVKPEDTYWYLSATSQLLETASNMFEQYCANITIRMPQCDQTEVPQ